MGTNRKLVTLVPEIIHAIELRIRKGRYPPGQQLVERELAEEFGVSRVPVREAIRRLASQGILDVRPYKGAIVRKLSRREALDVLEILGALGTLSVVRAAERIGIGDHRKRLAAFVKKEKSRRQQEKQVKEWIDINFPFYQLLAEISCNRLIPDLLEQYQLQMYRLVWDIKFVPNPDKSTVGDHLAVAEAVLKGDAEEAVKAYDRSLHRAQRVIEALPASAFASERD